MVGLLVVAGAIMGINYAAKGRGDVEEASLPAPATTPPPKVKLQRLTPNAYVAPSGALPPTASLDAAQASSAPEPSKVKPRDATNAANAPNAKSAPQTPGGIGAKTRKPSAAKTIDTETPLIMD
jgi:hypothetical protein